MSVRSGTFMTLPVLLTYEYTIHRDAFKISVSHTHTRAIFLSNTHTTPACVNFSLRLAHHKRKLILSLSLTHVQLNLSLTLNLSLSFTHIQHTCTFNISLTHNMHTLNLIHTHTIICQERNTTKTLYKYISLYLHINL